MNRALDLDRIGKCLDAYDRHDGNERMQNGFAFAMLKECYPEEEDFDTAKRRLFAANGKTTGDVYSFFRKIYDDSHSSKDFEVSKHNANPENFSAEQENDFLRRHPYQAYLKVTQGLPQNIRDMSFGLVFAEENRSNVAEAYADKLLSMSEKDRNSVLWGAYVLSPESASGFFKRVGNRLLENLGDEGFNISNYWEQSQKGVNPNTIYDAVKELDALDENGKIKPEKLSDLNKKLNALRSENTMFNEESSQVYGEKIRNAVRHNRWEADDKEYTSDFIESEYKKGQRYKDVFNLVSQLRDIKRTRYEKQNAVMQTIEDATVVGVEMLKYVGASALGTAVFKNPWASASLVGAVMYSEFKPQMFNALRHEGNMSVEDANKYANFATAGMIAANYVGYTSWLKAIKPSSYLLGTEISKANARDYLFHAIKEIPKGFMYRGGTETASEYMESVVELATKSWVADHEGATFDQRQLWDNFCQDFKDTSRIMPTLMFGSTLFGGGLAINKVRGDSGAGWNFKQLISPSEAINHNVQANAAKVQADKAIFDAAGSLGDKSDAYDFARKYENAKTDEERAELLSKRFDNEDERNAAKSALENVDKFDREVGKAFANVLSDAARKNAEETEELNRRAEKYDVFDEVEDSSAKSPKFTIIENLLDKFDARDSVVMVESESELEKLGYSPESAKSIMESLGKKGFYSDKNDKIYMLSSHFANGVDAFRTFAHERGHWIAQKIKETPEYNGMLQRIVALTGGEENLRSLLPSSYAKNNLNEAAEEYLMRVVERVAMEDVINANQKGVWNFFKGKFKKWFGGDKTFATLADKEIASIARDIYKRSQVSAKELKKTSNNWEAVTPESNGKRASGQWQVVDADKLITSTDKGYDDKLQPRNRTRKGSDIQTAEIATNLNPDLLGVSAKSSDGAPIVDSRGMVISGNGRTLAIRKAYTSENTERAQAYKDFVLREAERLGIDISADIKNPMLVRRVDNLDGISMEEFAARSNKSDVAKMSNAENAIADARRILDAHLLDQFFPSDNGDVLAASNNDFITAFIDIIGGREEYIDKNGARKANLAPRIKAAVLAAMLNPEKRDIVEDLLDNPQGWSGLINGLMGSVANLAKLDGNIDYDLAKELSEAVEIYVRLQRSGESVATFNAQEDFLQPKISEEIGFLVELFEKNSKTPTGISGVLNEYYKKASQVDTTTQDMFGAENPSKIQQLRAAYNHYATSLTEEPKVSWKDDTRAPTELDALNKKFKELYDRYKGGDQKAYDEAVKLVADEARRKGYDVKVYHGTGADGYNVASAKSDHQENGEGNQAHGKGLYMAVARESANKYMDKARKDPTWYIGDEQLSLSDFSELGISEFELEESLKYLAERTKNPLQETKDLLEYWKEQLVSRENEREKVAITKTPNNFENREQWVDSIDKGISQAREWVQHLSKNLRNYEKIISFIEKKGKTLKDFKVIIPDGKVFDWFTNLKPEELLDEDELIIEQDDGLQRKILQAWAEIEPLLKERFNGGRFIYGWDIQKFDFDPNEGLAGRDILRNWSFQFEMNGGLLDMSFNDFMLKHGIRGISYDGRQDGRCFVSFEGGSAVKLQDPFTFDDKGELIPLSERFDEGNPDMRWRDVEEPSPEERAEAKRQIAEVKAKWTNPDGTMKEGYRKAPNGKPSKLSEKQWLQVRTPNFKKWFGDWENDPEHASKVVDENGEPLVVWHATDSAFNAFDIAKFKKGLFGKGFYFSDNQYAYDGKYRMPVFLDIKNPILNANSKDFKNKDLTDNDGVINHYYNGNSTFVAKESTQIKSATDNVGTFNGENPDIRWREVDDSSKIKADKWAENPENLKEAMNAYFAEIAADKKIPDGQIIIDPDRIRAHVPDYEISDNSSFVEAGDKILELAWADALKRTPKNKPVVLLTGNPAAGKGTAMSRGLLDNTQTAGIVFDAPQNSFESVEKRVCEAIDSGHKVQLIQIYNDPITSWKNALERGIGKDNEEGKRGGGRFLPQDYFIEKAYKRAQGKVEKIENILKKNYGKNLETIYIDSTGNNPKIVSPEEAKAWDYSVSNEQVKEIERITDENRDRIKESSRLRGDKKNPLTVISPRLQKTLAYGNIPVGRNISEELPSGDEQGDARDKRGVEREGSSGESHLKALLRQERTENPVIWASIVLAREILNGRGITKSKVEKVLPSAQFDGSRQNYAVERAKRIAEKTKLTQKDFAENLDKAVQKAESDIFWQEEFVENAYRAFSKGGEEYGFAKQKLLQYLKGLKNKELNKVKGYKSEDFDVDLIDAILKAQEAEPERVKAESAPIPEEELDEADGEFDGDKELSGKKTPLAPTPIRDVIGSIRKEVTKRIRSSDGDAKTLNEKYRKTLVNILSDAVKELVYGKEREDINKKIEQLKNVKHAVITVKDGERAGQKIDNFTLRAEHIALRIFNRGVRDTKKALAEKFDAIIARKGKKPSRMERDDKRPLAGDVQMRIYNLGRVAEMDAEELEKEHLAAVDRLNNVDKHFVEDAAEGEVRADIEDVRAEVANTIHDIKMFGDFRNKSRAEMAEGVEFLEKYIESETEAQKERVEQRKAKNAEIVKIISDALKMSKHNAAKDSKIREATRRLFNSTLPFDSWLAILGEAATGAVREKFEAWRKDFISRVDKAGNGVANEVYAEQKKFISLVEDTYEMNFSDALRRLLTDDANLEQFSNADSESKDGLKNPMSLAKVLQLYASALQENYVENVYLHRAIRSEEYQKIQDEIMNLEKKFPNREDKRGDEWKAAKEQIERLEKQAKEIAKGATADYIRRVESVISEKDKAFIDGLRKMYGDALPSISEVAKRVIGLPIEQADTLYMPVKIKRGGNLGEGTPQVPVVPKSLSQRVPHMRDFDERANVVDMFLERAKQNAQFKHFSELYIEMRGIFGNENLQTLIEQRCGADVLGGLKNFIADIATGETRGLKNKEVQKANGLVATMILGFNLGSGFRQVIPGVMSFSPYIGIGSTIKNVGTFFTPEGFSAALEICRSENGRRRFAIGNMQILEEMLSTPDQNKFWAAYKRYALVFNRGADMLSIMLVGQGIYRSGTAHYLSQGLSIESAKERAMSDMWQLAERTQASGRMHNMSLWQRRGGDIAKALGMFSSPPQLMFSKIVQDARRAIKLGAKTSEGRAAAWNALKSVLLVSMAVEGSYALSGVVWNALLKGFFDDDDKEFVLKQMALGPFGGLFVFGRLVEGAGSNYGASLSPLEQLAKPMYYGWNTTTEAISCDWDKAGDDFDKLLKSVLPPYRDIKKVYDNRIK